MLGNDLIIGMKGGIIKFDQVRDNLNLTKLRKRGGGYFNSFNSIDVIPKNCSVP